MSTEQTTFIFEFGQASANPKTLQMGIKIHLKEGESAIVGIRKLRKTLRENGHRREQKRHEYFQSPSDRRRNKKYRAMARIRKQHRLTNAHMKKLE